MKIKIIADVQTNRKGDWIRKGEILEARRLTFGLIDLVTPFQIIEGEHAGKEIPFKFAVKLPDEKTYTEAEYSEINQELLQRREEVGELTHHKETLEWHMEKLKAQSKEQREQQKRLNKEILALQESLEMVRSDRQMLLKQIEQEVDQQKVVLPKEVAEAIERKRNKGQRNYSILDDLLRGIGMVELSVKRWAVVHQDELFDALVNGYTVEPEQTPKEKAIQHCIENKLVARGKSEHDVVSAIMNILEKN